MCIHTSADFQEPRPQRMYVQSQFEARGPRMINGTATLWSMLKAIIENDKAGKMVCIINALDECKPSGRSQLVRWLSGTHLNKSDS